jgi:hypothetical protein
VREFESLTSTQHTLRALDYSATSRSCGGFLSLLLGLVDRHSTRYVKPSRRTRARWENVAAAGHRRPFGELNKKIVDSTSFLSPHESLAAPTPMLALVRTCAPVTERLPLGATHVFSRRPPSRASLPFTGPQSRLRSIAE